MDPATADASEAEPMRACRGPRVPSARLLSYGMTREPSAMSKPGEPESDSPEVLRILTENHARFLGFLERRVGSRDVAEDILQEAFVRSLDHADSLHNRESAVAWFYRVLRNALTDYFRRQESRGRALERFAAESSEDAVDTELETVACECILSLLETLKPEYAAALRRVDLDGLSVRGYSQEAGISPSNAGVRLHRARESLRKQLVRSCGTCLTHGCFDCQCGNPQGGASQASTADHSTR
jgi:RNA polymerase sigma factor (sigma-70 family)